MAQPGTLFVMARVPETLHEPLWRPIVDNGLDAMPGTRLSPLRNLHQTLSSLYPSSERAALRAACAELEAHAFTLQLERLQSVKGRPPRILWMYVPRLGTPDGVTTLAGAVRSRLRQHGIAEVSGFGPHVTVSYDAASHITPLDIAPVPWRIDTIELVEVAGRGSDYRYEVVEAFPLRPPAAPPPTQLDLLG
jgi:2'-5' RNA ligase